jgi:hypothetical protein
LRVSVNAVNCDRDRIERADRFPRDALPLEQRAYGAEAVAVGGGLLELLLGRGPRHALLQLALDLPVAARQEVDDRLDVGAISLA